MDLLEWISEFTQLDVDEFYQRYWWLLVEPVNVRPMRSFERRLSRPLWPVFWGHRYPLGGEKA